MSNSKGDSKSKQQTFDCEEDRNKRMRVIRLQSLGNTCYLNPVLQNLLYLYHFRGQLIHTMTRIECKLILKNYLDLETLTFANYNKKTEPGNLTTELFRLKNETAYQLSLRIVTLDSVQNVIVRVSGKFSDGKNYPENRMELLGKYTSGFENILVFTTFIDDIFGGKMFLTVKCDNCKKILVINEDFLDTSLHSSADHFNIKTHKTQLKYCSEDEKKFLTKYAFEFENICALTSTFIDDTFGKQLISIVKCGDCGNILNRNKDFLDISLHLQADSKKDGQISNPSYNQGEMEPKSEEEMKVKSEKAQFFPPLFIEDDYVCNNCAPQIASKQDEDTNSESSGNKDKKDNTTIFEKISSFFPFDFINKLCGMRKYSSESIAYETKDAAAEIQKRQKQFEDCKDNKTKYMHVIGLYNLGNTCYFNSVLQNLLYLRPFKKRLIHTMTRTKYKLVPKKHPELETIEFSSEKKSEPGQLTQELFNLIQETVYQCEATEETSKRLKYGKNTSRTNFKLKTVLPRAIQDKIVNKHVKFSDGSQQDSHELFRFLLDMVKYEEIKRLETAFWNYSVDKDIDKYASEFENIFVFTGTFIDDTFGGKMISTVKCEGCGNILEVNEDFLDISLPLPEHSKEYNIPSSNQPQSEIESNSEEEVKVKSKDLKRLEYYLIRFFSPIFLEKGYVCNDCNPQLINKQDQSDDSDSIDYDALKFTSAEKQFHIKTVGPVLTIHLNRFSQTGFCLKKMNKPVEFPLELDMLPFCTSDTSIRKDCDNKILYGLRGIVCHLGGMLGGHYVAYVNIADWNVPSKISSSDSAKSRIVEKSNGKINSTDQPMDTDPAQGSRMPLASENFICEPSFQPTPPLTSSSLLKHVTPTEDWYYISDSYVSRANHNQVFSSQAYILFYERLPLVTKDTHV